MNLTFLKFICLLILSGLFLLGCKVESNNPPEEPVESAGSAAAENLTEEQRKVKGISDSENLLQSLSSELKSLARNFSTEPADVAKFVEQDIDFVGLDEFDLSQWLANQHSKDPDSLAEGFYWPINESSRVGSLSDVWDPLLTQFRFEDCQIGVLKASFPDDAETFEMETKFEGRARSEDGRRFGVKGYQTLVWEMSEIGAWKIVAWNQTKLKVVTAAKPLFEDVTEIAIPDAETRSRIQSSSHQEMILKFTGEISRTHSFKHARVEYQNFDDWESAFQYPSVSVLDLDQDGYDDLFVTDRWQAAQLLRNRGDGTFEDVTKSSGLQVDELANCTYFFDYDNDGDSDAFVGRSMGPSQFFVNEDGVFVPDEATNSVLEESRFVLAASVVDVNRDGLLDLYLSTYAYGQGPVKEWFDKTTTPDERLKTRLKIERSHTYVDRGGPPNILLMNRGGEFDWVKIDDALKQYRDSYQSVWTDLDGDGDQDVYVCNDFSPDAFLRNDTQPGSFETKFTDVTEQVAGGAVMGFAMGASWGDFDNDGDLDLYVSNMYSKAGMRIVSQLDDVDERLRVSAHGNFLYENENGQLKQVAGSGPTDQHVSSVGWSYGGQFADFDNDGRLDIYVSSGFYSPPREVANDKDL